MSPSKKQSPPTGRAALLVERWRLWWKCMDCKAVLDRHDPQYERKHSLLCPVAQREWPAKEGFGREWRHHVWIQQELERHQCDCGAESETQESAWNRAGLELAVEGDW